MSDVPRPPVLSSLAIRWGTAHLAWGVAILAALVFAAQETPLETSPRHERLCLATFVAGLATIAILGWVQIDRGWKLRNPSGRRVMLRLMELLGNLVVVGASWHALARGAQSRLLATGLDRLLVTACLSAGLSMALFLGLKFTLYRGISANDDSEVAPDHGLPYWLVASQVVFAGLLEWLELQPW